jgi:hypothetical protein
MEFHSAFLQANLQDGSVVGLLLNPASSPETTSTKNDGKCYIQILSASLVTAWYGGCGGQIRPFGSSPREVAS